MILRKLSSSRWLHRHQNDIFSKLAVAKELRARSAFKLEQIQSKYSVINKSSIVIDLGSSPGGYGIHVQLA